LLNFGLILLFVIIISTEVVYAHTPTYDGKGFPERVDCFGLENKNQCNVDFLQTEIDYSGSGEDPNLIDWITFNFGSTNKSPLSGDWDGDGKDTIGIYDSTTATFFLKNSNNKGLADIIAHFGSTNMIPLSGDWDGDGKDTIGVYDSTTATFFLKNSNDEGLADIIAHFGPTNMIPLSGDWDGDGKDTIGIYQKNTQFFSLQNTFEAGKAEIHFRFGPPENTIPIIGDWNNDGSDKVGISFENTFLLRQTNVETPNLWETLNVRKIIPSIILANYGATIIWENHDDVVHSINGISYREAIARNEKVILADFNSGDIKPGETFKIKLDETGAFFYYDKYFPNLKGRITVFEEKPVMNAEIETIYSFADRDPIFFFRYMPTGIVFTQEGKMFVSENGADVRIFEHGELLEKPFLSRVDTQNFPLEDGVTPIYQDKYPVNPYGWRGIALDPDYENNHYVYLTRLFNVLDEKHYELKEHGLTNRHSQLIRVTDVNNTATDLKILINDVGGIEHAGGPILFGDDGKIYFPTGDNSLSVNSQNLKELTGKILRINPDGSIPNDNPFENSPIFTLGHREVFGIAKDPITGNIFSIDNGPEKGDEINLLKPGGNYGWPVYSGYKLVTPSMLSDNTEYVQPLLEWPVVIGPTSAIFYTGDKHEQLKNKLIVGTWNLGMIRVITLDEERTEIKSDELLFSGYKPVVAISQSPDGDIYFSTSTTIERIVDVNLKQTAEISLEQKDSLKPSENLDMVLILIILALVIFGIFYYYNHKKKRQS